MKIVCFVEKLEERSGWGRYSLEVISALKAQGDDVLVFCNATNPAVDAPQIDVLPDPIAFNRIARMRILRPFVLSRVLREREFMPDIIHCFVEPYAPFAAKLSRQSGAPFVLTAHGTYAVRSLADVSFGPLQKQAYRVASMIVCISAYTQKRLRMFEPDLPTAVIPNGVRIPTLDSGHNSKEPLLLSVGVLKERKGYRYVFEALPQIAQATPAVTYVAVGDQRDSAYARSLREIVERLGLQQRVTFKEGISDAELDDLYRRARVFVLTPVSAPLNFEGFGLVYLEANARGVPVVGSFENGGEDAIVDGRTGYLTKPCNPQDIAEKVTRLLQLPDATYATWSAECRSWARSRSWHRTVDRYRDLYCSLTNKA